MDLTKITGDGNYNVGEMAHVIARSASGPRGESGGGADAYDNLILLCPTCHREIDKAPTGAFPEAVLRAWKRNHEDHIRKIGLEQRYETAEELVGAVAALLAENHAIWKTLGPRSEVADRDPGSNAYALWELRRADRIVPNNRRIVNLIRANQQLLNPKQNRAFAEFVAHAEGFEEHVHNRLDYYPLFPRSFAEAFGE